MQGQTPYMSNKAIDKQTNTHIENSQFDRQAINPKKTKKQKIERKSAEHNNNCLI